MNRNAFLRASLLLLCSACTKTEETPKLGSKASDPVAINKLHKVIMNIVGFSIGDFDLLTGDDLPDPVTPAMIASNAEANQTKFEKISDFVWVYRDYEIVSGYGKITLDHSIRGENITQSTGAYTYSCLYVIPNSSGDIKGTYKLRLEMH